MFQNKRTIFCKNKKGMLPSDKADLAFGIILLILILVITFFVSDTFIDPAQAGPIIKDKESRLPEHITLLNFLKTPVESPYGKDIADLIIIYPIVESDPQNQKKAVELRKTIAEKANFAFRNSDMILNRIVAEYSDNKRVLFRDTHPSMKYIKKVTYTLPSSGQMMNITLEYADASQITSPGDPDYSLD